MSKRSIQQAQLQHDQGQTRSVVRGLRALFFLVPLLWILVSGAGTAALPDLGWAPADTIKAYLLQKYPWTEVEVLDLHPNSQLPAERPDSITVERTPPGRSLFRLHFRGHKSVTVDALVKAFDQVIMARGSHGKGYILDREDVYATTMETNRIPKGAVRVEDRVIGKELLRSVMPNRPITRAMVSESALIKRGHRVAICIDSPGFTIRTAGEIKEDAAVGEQVRVLNLSSQKTVIGLLVDENTVRVEM